MRGHHCSAHQQSLRLLPLLVLATLMTSFVSNAQPRKCGPEIITYGECPHGAGQQLPYLIQTPLAPLVQPKPIAPCTPIEKKSYGYNIDGIEDPHQPPGFGAQLPVRIQEPILPPGASSPPAYRDPLRGKSYGIGIQQGPSAPDNTPALGLYDFGVQNSIPAPHRPAAPSGPYRDPLGVQVQPAAIPNQESPLWGSLPIGIERPAESRNGPGVGTARPVPRLQGLTSNIDKLLLPVNCPIPMDGSAGGPSGGGYPGGNGPSGGGPEINRPLGGGGYAGGNGYPLGGGGYTGGNGPLGGGGYPLGGGGYTGGNGYPLGGGGYTGGNGYPLGGGGYTGGIGPLGGGGYPKSGFSSCG